MIHQYFRSLRSIRHFYSFINSDALWRNVSSVWVSFGISKRFLKFHDKTDKVKKTKKHAGDGTYMCLWRIPRSSVRLRNYQPLEFLSVKKRKDRRNRNNSKVTFGAKKLCGGVDFTTNINDVNLVLRGNRLRWVESDTENTTCVVARSYGPKVAACTQ